ARARRVDFSGRAQCAGHCTVDRQRLAELVDRAVDRLGYHTDIRGICGARHIIPGNAAVLWGIAVSEARIEVSDLAVRYGGVVAVAGVSFTVARGEHVTLLGPSGCGKTTTFRSIAEREEAFSVAMRLERRAVYS